VGLYPHLDVARRSRSPDQYIFQARIAPADEGLQCLRNLIPVRLMSASALPWYVATPDILQRNRDTRILSGRAGLLLSCFSDLG